MIEFDHSFDDLSKLACEEHKIIRVCERRAPDSFWAESSAGAKVPLDMCQKLTKIKFSQNQDLNEPKCPGGIRDDHGKSSVAS